MTRAQRARGEGDEERGCGRSRSTRRATGSSYDYWGSRLHVHSCETVLRISGVTLGVLLRCWALRLVQGIQTSLVFRIRVITLEVLKYMWSLPKVTHVVSIAVEDRTKTSLAELQGGEGELDLFFSFFDYCLRLLRVMPRLQKYTKFTFMKLE